MECSEGTHDAVVKAIAERSIVVGTVHTLEQITAEGKINLEDFKIIHQIHDGFPFFHSTRLYPEWPMAILPHVDKELGQKVVAALFQLNNKSSAPCKIQHRRQAVVNGYVQLLNFSELLSMVSLQIDPCLAYCIFPAQELCLRNKNFLSWLPFLIICSFFHGYGIFNLKRCKIAIKVYKVLCYTTGNKSVYPPAGNTATSC